MAEYDQAQLQKYEDEINALMADKSEQLECLTEGPQCYAEALDIRGEVLQASYFTLNRCLTKGEHKLIKQLDLYS